MEIVLSDESIRTEEAFNALVQRLTDAKFPTKFIVENFTASHADIMSVLERVMPTTASHIDLRDVPSSPEFVRVLQKCDRTTMSLRVRFRGADDDIVVSVGKNIEAISGNLTELNMTIRRFVFNEWIHHEFPKLKKLVVIYVEEDDEGEAYPNAFKDYFTKSLGPSLKEMEMTFVKYRPQRTDQFAESMTRIVRKTPNLEKLVITSGLEAGFDEPAYDDYGNPRYSALDRTTSKANFALADAIRSLRQLRVLHFLYCNPRDFSRFVLRSIGPSLEEIDLKYSNWHSPDQCKELFKILESSASQHLKKANFGRDLTYSPDADVRDFAPFFTRVDVGFSIRDSRFENDLQRYRASIAKRYDYLKYMHYLQVVKQKMKLMGMTRADISHPERRLFLLASLPLEFNADISRFLYGDPGDEEEANAERDAVQPVNRRLEFLNDEEE